MLNTIKELNNKYASESLEIRKVRGSGGLPTDHKSIDLVLPRKFCHAMKITVGDYVTCELQRVPRSTEHCIIIKKLEINNNIEGANA